MLWEAETHAEKVLGVSDPAFDVHQQASAVLSWRVFGMLNAESKQFRQARHNSLDSRALSV
jgi:hypothetical protein